MIHTYDSFENTQVRICLGRFEVMRFSLLPSARYYNSDLSIWLSVDPLADKYPNLSPYTYCANNPVRIFDLEGESIWIIGEDGNKYKYANGQLFTQEGNEFVPTEGSFEKAAQNALTTLNGTKTGAKLLGKFENTEQDVFIKSSEKTTCDNFVYSNQTQDFVSGTIFWNAAGQPLSTTEGIKLNGITDLGHEFSHMYDETLPNKNFQGMYYDYCPIEEWRAVYKENKIRGELGIPYRTSYRVFINTEGKHTKYDVQMLRKGNPYFPPENKWKIKL